MTKQKEQTTKKVAQYLKVNKMVARKDGFRLFGTLDLHKYIGFLEKKGWVFDRANVYNKYGKKSRIYKVIKSV